MCAGWLAIGRTETRTDSHHLFNKTQCNKTGVYVHTAVIVPLCTRMRAHRCLWACNSRQLSAEPAEAGGEADEEGSILEWIGYTLYKGLPSYPWHSIEAPL